jgi:hypothetical protein
MAAAWPVAAVIVRQLLAFAALNAAQAAWKSVLACSSVAARLSVRTRKRAGPITVIDQNQRFSGRLDCRSSYSRPISAPSS